MKIPLSRMSKREFSFADMRPSRVAKKTVSYCDTSNSELKFDEVGYERSKTKNDPCRGHGFQRTNHLEKIPSSRMSCQEGSQGTQKGILDFK